MRSNFKHNFTWLFQICKKKNFYSEKFVFFSVFLFWLFLNICFLTEITIYLFINCIWIVLILKQNTRFIIKFHFYISPAANSNYIQRMSNVNIVLSFPAFGFSQPSFAWLFLFFFLFPAIKSNATQIFYKSSGFLWRYFIPIFSSFPLFFFLFFATRIMLNAKKKNLTIHIYLYVCGMRS